MTQRPRMARPLAPFALAAFLALGAVPALAGYDEGLTAYQKRDWTSAIREFRPLATQGNAAAQARLGHMLFEGLGGTRDDVEALKLLNAAAASGDSLAQYWLGSAYFNGRAVPKDISQALVWFGRSADKGQPEALHAMGEIHFNGLGINKDEGRGIEYFKRGAEKDWPPSLDRLAQYSWDGRAMPTDKVKALEYARPAAEAGRPVAQFIVGVAYLLGQGGVEKDAAKAAPWFRKAADQGHPQSQHNLGVMYLNGSGVPKSQAEGYFWMALGAERAPANLKANYEKERDAAGTRLSPAELEALRGRVALWRPNAAPGQPSAQVVSPASRAPMPPGQQSATTPPPATSGKISSGSGFVVSADGVVMTNAHVVEQCRSITIKPQDAPAQVVSLKAKDSANDMALLKTSLRLPEVARFRQDRPLRSGDEVVVIGFPLSSLLSREPNVTAGVVSALNGMRGDPRHYQITAPVQKGNSGGPLIDMSGNIVGIVTSKLNAMKIADKTGDLPQNINFAIKADLARSYLDSNGVSYQTAESSAQLSVADVGERIKRVTVFIECRME
ncbi:trypsin-like peptidase domain-containing protein [Paramagnetospirillum magneticum]|uniref:TPR repeat n=1 Tax=Paramagnetospirillum magneticum (strain ATCC 700264 / AMB-1) TaxID=342108 RepID=Q2W531_PARM1|nr:trypsin-like peptidase domain-containing protein [Paramagnetospirillum magneticum]BAE51044.1 TPR repeat [Paramagnetospirillum magneticum AMB-1]